MKNRIEMLCLNAISDDYENLIQIRKDIQHSLGIAPEDELIRVSLRRLMEKGYAEVFEYDKVNLKYDHTVLADNNWDDKWFFITEKGRIELERNP